VIETLRRYAAAGHAVLAVSHRPAVIAAAHTVIDLAPPTEPRSPTPSTHADLSPTPSTDADLSAAPSTHSILSSTPMTPIGDVIGVSDRPRIGFHHG
jgi:hypothetical protein